MYGGYCWSKGMHDSSLLHCIQKVRSWISWGNSDSNSSSCGFEMMDNNCGMCCHCKRDILKSHLKYHCQSCGRLWCENCIQGVESSHLKETARAMFNVKSCKLCFELGPVSKSGRRCSGKVYPSESPRQSSEPPSPSFIGERFGGLSPHALTRSSDTSFSNHPSPKSVPQSPSRSDEDEGEDSTSHFFSARSEYFHDASNVDSSSISARHEFYSFMSVGSSPSDSPSRLYITSSGVGHHVQLEQGESPLSQNDVPFDQEQAVLERPAKEIWGAENADDLSIFQQKSEKLTQPLDFETNGLIWFPPPPDDINDAVENSLFTYDDEDDEVGDSGVMFFPAATIDTIFLAKEKQHLDHKERAEVQGHFRVLVSQLLQGQGIIAAKDNCAEHWLDVVTAIAWQAAKFIRPDTSRGGSMDPCDYLKVKCVASGSPSER